MARQLNGCGCAKWCCAVLVEQWAIPFNDHRDAGKPHKSLWIINKSLGPWIL